MNITYWLRKTPRPVAILADDKRIEVPNNSRAWKDLTDTVKSLEPTKLTALDVKGNVIRSVVLETEDDGKAPPSVEMSDVQLFARLIAEAYEKSSKANQPIIDSAMGFVEHQSTRLLKAENEIERLRAHIHKQNLQIAELTRAPAPESEETTLLGSIVAGIAQGAAAGGNNLAALKAPQGAKK